MGRSVSVCVVTGYGINADVELAEAFRRVGARAARIHLNDLIEDSDLLVRSDIVAFPGGFSFGDHLGAGLVLSARFKRTLGERFDGFLDRGGLAIGICNGFQVLAKMGVLPDLSGARTPEVSLIHNESGRFEDSWVRVTFDSDSSCIWTRGLDDMEIPIRHGEGRFVTRDASTLEGIETHHLAAVRYAGRNPNGSVADIAGICNRSGRVLGLMPHPEAFLYPENHPRWSREPVSAAAGLELLARGVEEAQGV